MPRVLLALALLALLAVGALYATRGAPEPTRSAPEPTPKAAPAEAPQTSPAARGATPAHTAAATSMSLEEFQTAHPGPDRIPANARSIALPDGARVPVINGAYGAPDMLGAWPDDRPWSPIVRIDTDSFGEQWYVHADESRSQTILREVRRSGESAVQPMTLVYTPIEDAVPLQDEGPTLDQARPADVPSSREGGPEATDRRAREKRP